MAARSTQRPTPGPRTTPLSQHVLNGVRDLNEVIGHGSYAIVKKLKFRGLECVGKKMHDILYLNATPQQREDMLTRFQGECELLSRLRHPCVVQFMGVYFEEDTPLPILVMERLHSTLAVTIDRYGVLPDTISYTILCDVTLGLRYLHEHSPSIIHRDLSANNVLLTPHMSAKISDLGVAKILNLTPAQISRLVQTKAPGTPCYMPPEALSSRPKYNTKIDIYSMGVMLIHVFCGEWPFPSDAFQPDPHNPHSLVPVTEVERRAEFLSKIDDNHPLTQIMLNCLSNNPSLRPDAAEIHTQLEEVKIHLPAIAETRIQMYQQLKLSQDEMVGVKKALNERVEDAKKEKDVEIEALRQQVRDLSLKCSAGSTEPLDNTDEIHDPHLHPLPSLHWKQCAHIPVKCSRMQGVVIGDDVYVGGGVVEKDDDDHFIFKYDLVKDEWTRLLRHCVFYFGLCHFQGELVSVGGALVTNGQPTNKVYRYKKADKKWVEHLEPMLTNRAYPTLFTTASAIVACGGRTNENKQSLVTLAIVEVYSSESSAWYKADSLPQPFTLMSSATLGGSGYLLGGCDPSDQPSRSHFCIDIAALIYKAVSSDLYYYILSVATSIWKTLPDTPLGTSTVVVLSGLLLAIGGYDGVARATVHAFIPPTNSWVKLPSGDLPVRAYATTAIPLPNNRVMVIGGRNQQAKDTSAVYIGSIVQPGDSPKAQIDKDLIDGYYRVPPEEKEPYYLPIISDQEYAASSKPEDWAPPFYLEKVVALHDYIQADDDELTFTEGDIIYVLEKVVDSEWHTGVLNGVEGLFPANHVKIVS